MKVKWKERWLVWSEIKSLTYESQNFDCKIHIFSFDTLTGKFNHFQVSDNLESAARRKAKAFQEFLYNRVGFIILPFFKCLHRRWLFCFRFLVSPNGNQNKFKARVHKRQLMICSLQSYNQCRVIQHLKNLHVIFFMWIADVSFSLSKNCKTLRETSIKVMCTWWKIVKSLIDFNGKNKFMNLKWVSMFSRFQRPLLFEERTSNQINRSSIT